MEQMNPEKVRLMDGTILQKKKRKVARHRIIANFQFSIDGNSKEIFEGITTNISSNGFGSLTKTVVKEGQVITITTHSLPEFTGRKVHVVWVQKELFCVEAGAAF